MAGPLIRRKRTLAAKVETSPGTAIAVSASDAAFHVFDAEIQPDIAMEERMKQNGFARLAAVPGPRIGSCTFKSHFFAGSASPAGMAVFLPAVGMGLTTGEYVLDSIPPEGSGSTQECLTLASYQAGRVKKIYGAMGNMKITIPAGKLAIAEFDYKGKWAAVADGAALAPTYPSLAPLRAVSMALTIGAWTTPVVAQITIDLGNEIYLREDVNDATGVHSAVIANRYVKLTVNPESRLVSEKDVWGEWLSGTEASLSCVLSGGSGTATITATKLQWLNPKEADRNGLEVDEIECGLNDDDLSIVFDAGATPTPTAAAATPTPTP